MILTLLIIYCGFILWYLVSNLEKGLQAFIISLPFVQTYMRIDLAGASFRVATGLTIIITVYIIFLATKSRKIRKELSNMRFNRIIGVFCGILLLAVLLNLNTFSSNIGKYFYFIFKDVSLIYIGWLSFSRLEDGASMNRKLLLGFVLLAIYGVGEALIQSNPILDYFSSTLSSASSTDDEFSLIMRYASDQRGYRVQSIFYHPYPWGGTLACMTLFPLYFLFKSKKSFKSYLIYLITYSLFIFNIIFTRGRSTLIPAVFIFGCALLFSKNKGKGSIIGLVIIVLAAIPLFFPAVIEQISPYFSFSEESGGLHGSSTEMRTEQLAAAFYQIRENVWTGNGFGYLSGLLRQVGLDSQLQGAESLWLAVLIEHGVIGLVAYIVLFIRIIYHFLSARKKFIQVPDIKMIATFVVIGVLGYILFITTTGTMNTLMFFFLLMGIMGKYIYLVGQSAVHKRSVAQSLKLPPQNNVK